MVVDAGTHALHAQACAYLASLRSRGCSLNTERVYAGRVALYLSYCQGRHIDWAAPSFMDLSGLQRWLITEPLPARGRRPSLEPRFRSPGTANAVMTVVSGFLKFGAVHGWVTPETVAVLSEPKQLFHLPPGYDPGERGHLPTVEAGAFRFAFTDPGCQDLSSGQIAAMIALVGRARDRFLIALLACTGLRIGEALGLCAARICICWPPPGCLAAAPRGRISTSGAARIIPTARWPSPGVRAPFRLPPSWSRFTPTTSTNATPQARPPRAKWFSSICSARRWAGPMSYPNAKDLFAAAHPRRLRRSNACGRGDDGAARVNATPRREQSPWARGRLPGQAAQGACQGATPAGAGTTIRR